MAALQGSILVTGGNRGIGLALIKHITALPDAPKHIFATSRSLKADHALQLTKLAEKHSNLHLFELDVTHTSRLPEIVNEVASIVGESGLNVLINNAGIYDVRSLQEVTVDSMMKSYEVNTVAPLMMTKQFLPLLQRAVSGNEASGKPAAIVVNISSLTASLDDNHSGGKYPSRSSKTALNMVTKSLSVDLKDDGIVAVAINPGWVKTDMGGTGAKITPEESVSNVIKVISSLDASSSGCFLSYDGKIIPW